jgi:hypothetical protein
MVPFSGAIIDIFPTMLYSINIFTLLSPCLEKVRYPDRALAESIPSGLIMERKGICYDVGREMYGNWRPDFHPDIIHRELQIIQNDLHCNAIRICGKDISRLMLAADDALKQGFEVWLSPELWNQSPAATLSYTVKAAEAAERLREKYPGKLVLSVGSELTLFMKGIIAGGNLWSRLRNAFSGDFVRSGKHNQPLNEYILDVTTAARKVYRGPITYASLIFERVNWELFDFVGVDHYRAAKTRDRYAEMLRPLLAIGKPVVVMELGCCTYQGAEAAGGQAFNIIDIKSLILHQIPLIGRFVRPRLKGHYVRDEALQASEVTESLTALDQAGINGAFVFTFVFPTNPYHDEPLYDLDMASYSLVKSYSDGMRGATYPDMPWEPKKSFQAVADYYVH